MLPFPQKDSGEVLPAASELALLEARFPNVVREVGGPLDVTLLIVVHRFGAYVPTVCVRCLFLCLLEKRYCALFLVRACDAPEVSAANCREGFGGPGIRFETLALTC